MNISFEWDEDKNFKNIQKHGMDFGTAQYAFLDPQRGLHKMYYIVKLKNAITVLEK